MKKIFIFLILAVQIIAGTIKAPLLTLDDNGLTATIKIKKIDVGMSGFVVQNISKNHTTILKQIVVSSFDAETQIATLKLSDYNTLKNSALPLGKWHVKAGDIAVLAGGYSRALLISPSEEIYYRITKSVNTQWLHSDIFTTLLSLNGHPTPLKEDFNAMRDVTSIGLIFIYLEQKVYTIDAKSFVILNISDAPLEQKKVMLPFYSRVTEIEANWFGEGNDELLEYEPYYYELLARYNKNNKQLYKNIEKSDKNIQNLLENFEIKE